MTNHPTSRTEPSSPGLSTVARIAAGVDPHPESQDAAALAGALAQATGAELMLVAIEPDLPLIIPGFDYKRVRRETEALLERTRGSLALNARTVIDTDLSIPRGIERVIEHERRDLVVVGSSRHGSPGEVSIARTTRHLVGHLEAALAIAPRELSQQGEVTFNRIAVGFDAGDESREALAMAGAIAAGSGARLTIRGLVEDRIPALGWPEVWLTPIIEEWQEILADSVQTLRAKIESALTALDLDADVEVELGSSGASLRELTDEVDLLVIGSRRWGPVARLLLGGTGEALVHGARCPLLVVPRPRD